MRNSLIFKLLGAFLLVVAIGGLVISWLVSRATQNAFDLYTTRNGQAWAQQLAPVLAEYYAGNLSWEGVDAILQSNLLVTDSSGMMGGSHGMGNSNGSGEGRGLGLGKQGSGGMWGMMGQRMILVDGQGIVIYDSGGEVTSQGLSPTELENGAPITVDNQLVGTILVTPYNLTGSGTPAGQFLSSVNRSILTSVIIASLIAMILGTILFLQITAPLRQLKKAASAIAHGDLSQRVHLRSRDELGELSQTFNRMAESLERVETQRQHLMADIAHELRTPLAVIQANLEGILDGVLPTDSEQLTAIHTETLLLNRLVGDLRLLSLAEAGELKLELQEAEMTTLIHQVVERTKPQAIQKGILLETEFHDNLPKVWIDPDRITQVLNNLISNALRYTPTVGKITIQAASSGQAGVIQISVTDPGPGIDPEDLPLVFDRFYRADKSRARVSGGSGLGLAIVKQLVEAHGGTVEAASPVFQGADQRGYGTRISFTLPATVLK